MKTPSLVLVLAMIAGYIDTYGFLSYRTYVSFMSGNTTQSGLLLGQGSVAPAVSALLAIVFFVFGVFAGTFVIHSGARDSAQLVFGLVATLLAVSVGAAQLGCLNRGAASRRSAVAMGIMNTAVSRVGMERVNVAFVTGTLNTMAQHLALAVKRVPVSDAHGSGDTHARRALLLLGVWASFLTGAVLAGAVTSVLGVWALLLPADVLLVLALLSEPNRLAEAHSASGKVVDDDARLESIPTATHADNH